MRQELSDLSFILKGMTPFTRVAFLKSEKLIEGDYQNRDSTKNIKRCGHKLPAGAPDNKSITVSQTR